MIITNRALCEQKMENLKNGFNAFAESDKLIQLLGEEIAKEKISVFFERTPVGCWIIPTKEEEQYIQ